MALSDSEELQTLAAGVSRGHHGAMKVVMDALETFAANNVNENEACLYLLLLSSRGYVGAKLWSLYKLTGSNAARTVNDVVSEAKEELEQLEPEPELEPGECIDRR